MRGIGIIRKVILVAELAWFLLAMEAFTDGGFWLLSDGPILLFGLCLLGFCWAARFSEAVRSLRAEKRSIFQDLRRSLPVAFEPALLVLVFLTLHSSTAFLLRVNLSESALEQYAHTVQMDEQAKIPAPHWVGLFRVKEVEVAGEAVRMITARCGLVDDCGLAYGASGEPKVIGEDYYEHLQGVWYWWFRSW